MDLVAVDWFKDTKRMDHVARRQGCAAQVTKPIFVPTFFLLKISVKLLHMVLFQSDYVWLYDTPFGMVSLGL